MSTATRPWAGPAVNLTGSETPVQRWQDRAACRGLDTDLFYVPDGVRGRQKTLIEQEAKRICADCPVARECRQAAAEHPEKYGVWGGLTESERGWSRR